MKVVHPSIHLLIFIPFSCSLLDLSNSYTVKLETRNGVAMRDLVVKYQPPSERISSRGIFQASSEANSEVHSLVFPNPLDVKSNGKWEGSWLSPVMGGSHCFVHPECLSCGPCTGTGIHLSICPCHPVAWFWSNTYFYRYSLLAPYLSEKRVLMLFVSILLKWAYLTFLGCF